MAARKIMYSCRFFSDVIVAGKNDVLFWKPELDAVASESRLENNIEQICAISSILQGENGILILPVPLRAWFLREYLPISEWRELPRHTDGRELAAKIPGNVVLPLEDIFDEMHSADSQVYLYRDNHWTPEAMKKAVELTGEKLGLRPRPVQFEVKKITGYGNLGKLAGASPESTEVIFPCKNGEDVSTDDLPEILLCGDSFFNIYSLPTSGFGAGAGFPELLEALFYCRVVSVSVDGGGESGARAMLPQLGLVPGDFDFVVWEFPVYEIQRSNWSSIPAAKVPAHQLINTAGGSNMTCAVKASAGSPAAGSINLLYRNVLAEFVVADGDGNEYLLCLPALLNGSECPLPAAGDTISVKVLTPEEGRIYSAMARESMQEENFVLRPLIYGESVQILHTSPRQ